MKPEWVIRFSFLSFIVKGQLAFCGIFVCCHRRRNRGAGGGGGVVPPNKTLGGGGWCRKTLLWIYLTLPVTSAPVFSCAHYFLDTGKTGKRFSRTTTVTVPSLVPAKYTIAKWKYGKKTLRWADGTYTAHSSCLRWGSLGTGFLLSP